MGLSKIWVAITRFIARRFIKKSELNGSDDPYNYPLF